MRILRLLALSAVPLLGASVDLAWTAAPVNPVGTQYNVWRWTGLCSAPATPTKLNSAPLNGLTFKDTTIAAGVNYCYYATSLVNGLESIPSPKAGVGAPPEAPGSFTAQYNIAGTITIPDTELVRLAAHLAELAAKPE